MTTTTFRIMIPAVALVAVLVAVLGGGDQTDPGALPVDSGAPAAGACHVSNPDCDDTVEPGEGDDMPVELMRSSAQELLGTPEAELSEEIRVARRGEEQFALTEDYVIGRMTVELDPGDDGYVVTAVTVELPEGPETFPAG